MRFRSILLSVSILSLVTSGPASANFTRKSSIHRGEIMQQRHRAMTHDKRFNLVNDEFVADVHRIDVHGNGVEWYNRVALSGALRVDGIISDRSNTINSSFNDEKFSDIYLNNAEVVLDAQLSCMTHVHMELYADDNVPNIAEEEHTIDLGDALVGTVGRDRVALFEEFYATFGNLAKSKWLFTFGKKYLPVGNYDRHAPLPSFTTLLSETQATAVQVSFVGEGGHGSIFAFSESAESSNTGKFRLSNWGWDAGYASDLNGFRYNVGLSWMHNMADVKGVGLKLLPLAIHVHHVPEVAVYGQIGSDFFTLAANYVSALRDFSPVNVPWHGGAAQPEAFSLELGFNFKTGSNDSTVSFGYQDSGEAAALLLPEKRYQIAYKVHLVKSKHANVLLDFELAKDTNYDLTDRTATGVDTAGQRHKTTGVSRVAVNFA